MCVLGKAAYMISVSDNQFQAMVNEAARALPEPHKEPNYKRGAAVRRSAIGRTGG